MKDVYDIVVIGSCTAGVYYAKKMADKGFKVLVAERLPEENVGKRLDIIHLDRDEIISYEAPLPQEGDSDYYHSFEYSASRSALGNFEKHHEHTVMVLDLAGYIARMVKWAKESGVEFAFESEFTDFLFDKDGKICGVRLNTSQGETQTACRLVADCSGITSEVRRKLPDGCTVENFVTDDKSKFYVTCRYIHFKDKSVHIDHTISWPYYKVWIAPQQNAEGALLGVGANLSFDYGEKALEDFLNTVKLPEFEVDYIQRGVTPYRRPPYSFVADGYICMGDSACITKPSNGEGIVANWYLAKIAVDVTSGALKNGNCPTASDMWQVNIDYQTTQGAKFAELLAQLTGAVDCSKEENDYEFKKNLLFKDQLRNAPPAGNGAGELVKGLLGGVLMGKIKLVTVKKLLHYAMIAGNIKKHYRNYPKSLDNYREWCKTADELWEKAGSMADVLEK